MRHDTELVDHTLLEVGNLAEARSVFGFRNFQPIGLELALQFNSVELNWTTTITFGGGPGKCGARIVVVRYFRLSGLTRFIWKWELVKD